MKLEEIRQRADAATEGEWCEGYNHYVLIDNFKGSYQTFSVATCTRKEDTEFIAHARQDIPWLISEIDRLNSGIDSVIYDLRNEDTNDPYVLDQVIQNLVTVLNGK
ncbi:hypothetical protein CEY02_06540 [Bacillus pumilus]|uniref:Ead/Ea22-like family protein n=1 Tax=Bacillus pumilus TaxID=1408 RepID=A0A2A5IXM8_BACPU|nr:hypothetical protein [Bacillus pumilus]PCK21866.1 hypothetical protein CEY02_06540 [Bacillus pumilus]